MTPQQLGAIGGHALHNVIKSLVFKHHVGRPIQPLQKCKPESLPENLFQIAAFLEYQLSFLRPLGTLSFQFKIQLRSNRCPLQLALGRREVEFV